MIKYKFHYCYLILALVKQHMVEGTVCSIGLRGRQFVMTLEGHKEWVNCSLDFSLTLGQAKITETDMVASNGVLHYIDTVLVPSRCN